uniref:Uncharacterized protein n=1 Tax=Lotharella oceanica TaxID=641309 RepID=A0A7S2X844_9EUKA|mmetsp:Transcript_1253/g.2413  ORF Transcript_1253/g.2413 Transcript_1253/m.2413 type:complete len:143 (+) Transcript_1253:144-572(+)
MVGMAGGAIMGFVGGMAYNRLVRRLRRNDFRLVTNTTLGGLALGGFLNSSITARRSIPSSVSEINSRRDKELKSRIRDEREIPADFSPYQRKLAKEMIKRQNENIGNRNTSDALPSSHGADANYASVRGEQKKSDVDWDMRG